MFWHLVVSDVSANVSEKHAVSIFWTEVTRLGSGGLRKEGWGKGANQRQDIWERGSGPIGSLQADYKDGPWVGSEVRE
jgi:hypothetical protein